MAVSVSQRYGIRTAQPAQASPLAAFPQTYAGCASSASMVFVTVGAAGSMFEGQRATGSPSRSSRYFVKFHSGGAPT